METKKITVNELRSLVRQIIKEEVKKDELLDEGLRNFFQS